MFIYPATAHKMKPLAFKKIRKEWLKEHCHETLFFTDSI